MRNRFFNKAIKQVKGPMPFRYVLLVSCLLFLLITAQGMWVVDRGIRPALMEIARSETQKIATAAINDAISKKVIENTDIQDVVNIDKNDAGQIVSVSFNTEVYNTVLADATMRAQEYLMKIEEGAVPGEENFNKEYRSEEEGIIYSIPLGRATNNALLAQLGPEIPVKFTAIGDVTTSLEESIIEAGVNNTYIRVSIHMEVDARVIIPFATDTAAVSTSIPVGMVFISGEVPQYYNAGQEGMPVPAIIQEKEESKMESE